MGEQEARAQGYMIRVGKLPMRQVAHALEVDETCGFLKAVVDTATNQILGATVLGIEGSEVMTELQIALTNKTQTRIWC